MAFVILTHLEQKGASFITSKMNEKLTRIAIQCAVDL